MSTNLNYKQVANVTRRTWDVETYEKRAQARQQALDKGEQGTEAAAAAAAAGPTADADKQEFRPAEKGAARPEGSDRAFLKARATAVMPDLEAQVGQSTFVDATSSAAAAGSGPNKTDGVTATGVGWHCKVCDCYLKDSHTYLDHINGRKHQRKLGFSMHVQRSTTDDLKSKLQALQQKKKATPNEEEEIDFNARVEQKDQALRERQEERRRKRKERKHKAKQQQEQLTEGGEKEPQLPVEASQDAADEQGKPVEQEVEGEEEEEPQIDPALAAMMGFSGFGGSARR